jgi:hypothetical protein
MGKNALGAIDDDVTDDTTTDADTDTDVTDDTVTPDADTDVADTDDEDADDAEAAFLAGLTPEQAKFYQGEQAKLAKANTNARNHRLARRALEKANVGPKPTPPGTKPTTTTGTPPVLDAAALLAQVRAEFAAESKVTKVQASVERELLAAGLVLPADKAKHGSVIARAVKLLGDLADLDPDDAAEEVAELRREVPALFAAKRRRPAGGAGGPARINSGSGSKPETVAGLFDG